MCSYLLTYLCSAWLCWLFVTLQTHVASGEVAKCPPVDKLCNINTDKVVERCFSCLFFSHYKRQY